MPAKGFLLAALAAALYGTNPVFAVPLYQMGLAPVAVLFFRYLLGLPLLIGALVLRGDGLALKRGQYWPQCLAGVIMAISSLALYQSYLYISASVASTLLFMYPVLTALLMTIFFHEKPRLATILSLILMACGLYLLTWTGTGQNLDWGGFALVFLSSITYAIYLVLMRVWPRLSSAAPLHSLLWQLLAGGLAYMPFWAFYTDFSLPVSWTAWLLLLGLAILPTLLSLFCTLEAIALIGPTPTAIFGALEPVTAVILSAVFLSESLTARELAGGALIIFSTLIVVINPDLEKYCAKLWRFHGKG